jgi:hypothetical protein
MAEGNSGGGNGGGLYLIVGMLVAAVFVVGFVAFGGHFPHGGGGGPDKIELNVTTPAAPDHDHH